MTRMNKLDSNFCTAYTYFDFFATTVAEPRVISGIVNMYILYALSIYYSETKTSFHPFARPDGGGVGWGIATAGGHARAGLGPTAPPPKREELGEATGINL